MTAIPTITGALTAINTTLMGTALRNKQIDYTKTLLCPVHKTGMTIDRFLFHYLMDSEINDSRICLYCKECDKKYMVNKKGELVVVS